MAVHPRVCGERGLAVVEHLAVFRFIPACAGNASLHYARRYQSAVHPRVCGERSAAEAVGHWLAGSSPRVRGTRKPSKAATDEVGGSSPRVRGTPANPASDLQMQRFIPACAGNAPAWTGANAATAVHPRVCGERPAGRQALAEHTGSSPRVRGTRGHACPQLRRQRFIPACAGNASSTAAASPSINGSSPRVRGTRLSLLSPFCLDRFIPACAGNAPTRPEPPPRTPVHPRVCGERALAPTTTVLTTGSSPRVRGTRDRERKWRLRHRFIPACAGNAASSRARCNRAPVHPRVCGERELIEKYREQGAGSSPRVRGTLLQFAQGLHGGRFIPACAGNAAAWWARCAWATVHPRVCGERVKREMDAGTVFRFIPACAGNAINLWLIACQQPVHPRVCGERGPGGPIDRLVLGSSPRVRGTPRLRQPLQQQDRFIPACAGNAVTVTRPMAEDYGSSPRVRGTLLDFVAADDVRRFIPACAGNAPNSRRRRRDAPVHPRVCGERTDGCVASRMSAGSSPRVRGTHSFVRAWLGCGRFIPACAGNALDKMDPALAPTGSSPRVRGTPSHDSAVARLRRFIPACAGNA